ncbi:nucleotide sugar dehydrogenase [Nocardia stercoris]|uniref:nucleotide sugar dehydrogenase n=1 Tax=Nocardia stercoris TaxID=2483361 RepID=UPI001F274916|nr:nucleotide sugar dehydrogenase [Nocardia stercoris]
MIGQGYVGLPLSVRAAQAGYRCIGFDHDERRIALLREWISPIEDVSDDQIAAVSAADRYHPTARHEDLAGFDVAVIAVPTPLTAGVPDLSYVESAGRLVGKYLRPGALVILESTSYPGTTRTVLGRVLEEQSGLTAGSDFHLGYSPERIDPGNPHHRLDNTPKLVSGVDEWSLRAAERFYTDLVAEVVTVGRCEEAELAKTIENTFRAVNIGLVNELAEIAHAAGIDFAAAMDAAATKPFGFMAFRPGTGVGGHCVPVDPMFLAWWARQQKTGKPSEMIELADRINRSRPAYVAERVTQLLAEAGRAVAGARILLLGLAYKPGTGDLRESPAREVARLLYASGATVRAADPMVSDLEAVALDGIALVDANEDEAAAADVVVLATAHPAFDYAALVSSAATVLDCCGRLRGLGAQHVVQL